MIGLTSEITDGTNIYISVHRWSKCGKVPCLGAQGMVQNRQHNDCRITKRCEDTSPWLGLSPIDTIMPHGLLMLRNCFLYFAVEHWFGCRAIEYGFAGDIGAIEVWLIDWLIGYELTFNEYSQGIKTTDNMTSYVIYNISLEYEMVIQTDLAHVGPG